MAYKLLSLFDGSGGFPLAGILCGVEPVAASEVEPYPIAVTRSRFPGMKHLGNVSKINGAEIEPAHVITFGSPCQDLSVAGKRAGIKHEAAGDEETTRSGLFMEAVRIIKEMREATNGIYPNVILWENVPGAFNSNGGEDFRIVLNELIKIVEPNAVMPPVPKAGWAYADCYTGDGWSLAYRVFDAQYWGVPQRRRRIHLVLDLRGQRAKKILFERDGLRGYFEAGANSRKGSETYLENGVGAANREGEGYCVTFGFPLGFRPENVNLYEETATTIVNGTRPGFCNGIVIGFDCYNQALTGEKAKTLTGAATDSDHIPCVVHGFDMYNQQATGEVSRTLKTPIGGDDLPVVFVSVWDARGNGDGQIVNTITGDHNNRVTDFTTLVIEEKTDVIVFDKEVYNSGQNSTGGFYISENGIDPSLRTEHPPGVCVNYIVRRVTPLECNRLQGFADSWGVPDPKDDFTDEEYRFWLDVRNTHAEINGKAVKQYTKDQMLKWYNKLHTDSAEYKMWGNGIALPPALYCMQGIVDALDGEKGERNVTYG